MPKRSLDITQPPSAAGRMTFEEKPLKKTERSHQENQERAYIAASRRGDRSLEARVESAKHASRIHKERTGKGFKISEEIVLAEEMYEEEDDDLPRHYRNLTAHIPTTQGSMSNRVNDYVSTQFAMRSAVAVHAQEIEKQFAQTFPQFQSALEQNRAQRSMYMPELEPQPQYQGSPTSPNFPSVGFSTQTRHLSISHAADDASRHSAEVGNNFGGATRHASLDMGQRPRAISSQPDSPASNPTPVVHSPHELHMTNNTMTPPPTAAPSTAGTIADSDPSPFTMELPNEVKQMVDLDWNDPMTPAFYGLSGENVASGPNASMGWMAFTGPTSNAGFDQAMYITVGPTTATGFDQPTSCPAPVLNDDSNVSPAAPGVPVRSSGEYFENSTHPTSHHLTSNLLGHQSTIGTPGGGVGDNWNDWIDFEH